jgi:predicted ATP-dependent protease
VSAQTARWVLLAYRLPREPSTPRIALWRRLRRLGVAQLLDGLVGLPLDRRTLEQFEWLAESIVDEGGYASVWTARPSTPAEERTLIERMVEAVTGDYRAVADAARAAKRSDERARRRTLARLRRTLHVVRARDFFPPPERAIAEAAVEELAQLTEVRS